MADISKIKTLDGTTYDIKDATARRAHDPEPLETKTYTNVIATANDNNGAGFFYLKVRADDFTNSYWHVKTRVKASVPGNVNYYTDTTFDLWGLQNTCSWYACVNRIRSTSYRPIYYNSYFRVSSTGYANGCGAWIGFNLCNSTGSTTTTLKREITVELLAYENCAVELQDELITPTNIPNRAAHTNWYASTNTSFDNFNAANYGLKQSGDSDTTSISNLYLYNGNYRADSILYRYKLLFQTDEDILTPLNNVSNGNTSTTKAMLNDAEFDPFGRIYYYNSTTTVSPGENISASALYWSQAGLDLRYTFNCGTTLTAHKPFYLVVIPTGDGKCRIASDSPWAQDLPTTNDGKWYILLGRTYSTYQMALHSEHPVLRHDGTSIRRVVPSEAFSSLSLGSAGYLAYSVVYRYQLLFQIDEDTVTPLNNVSNSTGTNKTMLTNVEFDPFGDIFYYAMTTTINADARVNGEYMYWHAGALDLRYTFNCGQTLTAYAPVYLKVSLQSNGKVKIANSTPWAQTLPTTNDGYYYIYLGRTYSTYQMSLKKDHPVYYHDGTNIREYIKPARRFVAILG